MLTLPAALVAQKNKLSGTAPWLVLLQLSLAGMDTLYLARNTSDVIYASHTYIAFPFEIDQTAQAGQGEMPSVSLRVANATRMLQGFIELHNGLVGAEARLMVVHAGSLAVSHAALDMVFTVTAAECSNDWVSLTLGAPNPIRQPFPLYRAVALSCPWPFKGLECAYSGAATTCNHTYDDCEARNNLARFGGRPGLQGNVRLA